LFRRGEAAGVGVCLGCGFEEGGVDVGEDGGEGVVGCIEIHGVGLKFEGVWVVHVSFCFWDSNNKSTRRDESTGYYDLWQLEHCEKFGIEVGIIAMGAA
jgi:hypothetical protein